MSNHSLLTGLDLHQPFHYIQENDPGAVGVGLTWFKKSTRTLTYRNDTNTGWSTILSPTSSNSLPPGSTWTDFMTAYTAASPGDTIELPNETIIQTSNLFIQKSIRIVGSGPLSCLKLTSDVSLSGSAQQIAIGYGTPTDPIPGVTLADFTIEHDRATVLRTIAISIFGHTSNVHIRNIKFKHITSTCVLLRNEGGTLSGVYVYDCTADEWWESFFEIREGSASDIYVLQNVGTLLAGGHPNPAVSRPYATIINLEEATFPGEMKNVHVVNNSFTSTLYDFSLGVGGQAGSGTDFNNSIGISVRQNNNPDLRYHRIFFCNNLYDGFQTGLWHIEARKGTTFPGAAYAYYQGNTFQNNGNSIAIVNDYGLTGDVIIVGDNDWIRHSGGQTGLVLPGDGGVATIIQEPPNRTTGP